MSIITPRTSQTYSPGMTANETPYGMPTHQQYVTTLAEYLASMYAYGGESRQKVLDLISPVYVNAKYGSPDPTDQDGVWSPATILAFSRFAGDYKGGSPELDSIIAPVAPGPNDFVETPEQTATRIAQANFEKQLDTTIALKTAELQAAAAEGAANRAFQAGENAADRQLSAAKANADIAAQMESIKGQIKSAAMSAFNNAFSNEVSKYGVSAGMYNTQESNRLSALQSGGSLSGMLQQILDERTNKAIESQLNPGDYLAREAQVRAMTAPQGTETPAYTDTQSIKDIIDKLVNWTPTGGVMARPTAPDQNTFAPPPGLQKLMDWQPTAPAPISAPSSGYSGGGGGGTSVADAIKALLAKGAGDASQRTAAGLPPAAPAAAPTSTAPTGWSGVRNEDVAYLTPGQRALVTTGLLGPSKGSDYTQYKVYNPNNNNSQYGPNDEIAPGSAVWLERFARGGTTHSPQFITGDPPEGSSQPNPEVVTIHNPSPETRVDVTPVSDLHQSRGSTNSVFQNAIRPEPAPAMHNQMTRTGMPARPVRPQSNPNFLAQFMQMLRARRFPMFADGVDMFDPNTLKLKSYPDEAYQNLASLRFLQGNMGKSQYNTLATGYAPGYAGQRIPESGQLNYGRYLQLAKDPVSLALVASSYKAGNRDLFAEVARAKDRAPFGQAVQTSLIRS